MKVTPVFSTRELLITEKDVIIQGENLVGQIEFIFDENFNGKDVYVGFSIDGSNNKAGAVLAEPVVVTPGNTTSCFYDIPSDLTYFNSVYYQVYAIEEDVVWASKVYKIYFENSLLHDSSKSSVLYPEWVTVITDTRAATANAIAATEATIQAISDSEAATLLANDAASNANDSAALADLATTAANDAAALANEKAGLAQDAADLANTNAGLAFDAATDANLAKSGAELATEAAINATNDAIAITNTATNLVDGYSVFEVYNPLTTYELYNKVYHNDSTYQYINATPSSGNEPPFRTSDTYWQLVSLAGLDSTNTVGTTTVANPNVNPSVVNSGTEQNAVLDFILPRSRNITTGTIAPVNPNINPSVSITDNIDGTGDKVVNFNLPKAPTFTVGLKTPTTWPIENPDVTNTGTDGNIVLNFKIPRSASVTVGSTTTLTPGSQATVTPTYNYGDVSLAFGIPEGLKGDTGENFTILGVYDTYANLVAAHPTGTAGEAWAVGTAYPYDVYIWDTNTNAWFNMGPLTPSNIAGDITIVNSGNYYNINNVEDALQQVYADKVNNSSVSTDNVADTIVKRSGSDINVSGINFSSTIDIPKKISWNDAEGTFDMEMFGGVVLQVGQENHLYGYVDAGVTITNGQVVYLSGVVYDSLLFKPTNIADPLFAPYLVMGFCTTLGTSNPGDQIYVTVMGKVHDINVGSLPIGTLLYVDPTQIGGFTGVKPIDPYPGVKVGAVIKSGTQGTVICSVYHGEYLTDLHDVHIDSIQPNQVLAFNAANLRWENTTFDISPFATKDSPTFTGTVSLPTGTTKIGQTSLAQGVNGTVTLPSIADTLIGRTTTDILTNKSLSDSTTFIVDSVDNTKKLNFDISGTTGVVGTISTSFTTNKTVNFQDIAGTIYVTGGTDVAIADGGTGASDAATARTNLGLAIGTNVQAYSATLDAVASGLYTGDDNITTVGTIGTGTWAAKYIAITHGGTGASDAATAATNLGLGNASSVQFGSLGIGTAASGTSGEIRATNNVTAYYSDARLKDFKGKITEAVDKIKQINGYYYTANEEAAKFGYDTKKLQVGVSAQELEKVLPEVVTEAPIGHGYLTVWYEKITPLLIEAIKEQQIQLDNQAQKIQELERRIFGGQ